MRISGDIHSDNQWMEDKQQGCSLSSVSLSKTGEPTVSWAASPAGAAPWQWGRSRGCRPCLLWAHQGSLATCQWKPPCCRPLITAGHNQPFILQQMQIWERTWVQSDVWHRLKGTHGNFVAWNIPDERIPSMRRGHLMGPRREGDYQCRVNLSRVC